MRIHPRTWEDGVMPLGEFPVDHRAYIADAVAQEKAPQRWVRCGYAWIESRAWHEWHWSRGRKLLQVGPTERRKKLSPRIRAEVIARDGLNCGLCKQEVEPSDVHIDHVFPFSRGGTDDLDNLQVAHSLCNIRKGARV